MVIRLTCITVMLVCLFVGLVGAQQKESTVAKIATTSPTPDPFLITPTEMEEVNAIIAELGPLVDEANKTYQRFLSAKTPDERYRLADQLWIAAKQAEPLQQKQIDWLGKIRKVHNCPDCLIVKGRLVPQPKEQK